MRNGLRAGMQLWSYWCGVFWVLIATSSVSMAQFGTGWGSSPAGAGEVGSGYAWGGGNSVASSGVRKDWRLGITGDNTDVGVYVRQVSPNSSAARAGINPGDIVVCVAYTQVGRVGNQVFDLGEQLNRSADFNGRVRVLVLSRVTGQLQSLQIQLDSGQSGLSGNLLIPSGRIQPNSIVTVELENVTRPYFVVRNGRHSFRLPAYSSSAIPFTLNYDPAYIAETDSYRVRATVTSNGQVTHVSDQPFVLTRGYPNTVQLTFSSTAGGATTLPLNPGVATNLPSNAVTVGYPDYTGINQTVIAAYVRFLGRNPTPVELAVWSQMGNIQNRLADMPIEMMGSQEYFDRVGNNNVAWLERVFGEILGRSPSAAELDQWLRRFGELRYSRTELLRQLKQASGR